MSRARFAPVLCALLVGCGGSGHGADSGAPDSGVPDGSVSSCRADRWCEVDVGVTPLNAFGSVLDAVHGSSTSDVWTVGQDGVILHWDGTHWSLVPSGTSLTLGGVWVASGNDGWAVGDKGTLLHWNGTAWSAASSGTANGLYGVWGADATHVWAVGDSGTILFWNGATWTSTTEGTQTLLAVSGTATDDVWAVGRSGTAYHWDGMAWTSVASQGESFPGVWPVARNDIWVPSVFTASQLLHWDGATWTTSSFAVHGDLTDVWGSAPNDGWAVVSRTYVDPQQGILHFDGTQWAEIASDPVTAPANFQAIWGIGGEIWAVGGPGSSSAGNAFLIWHRGS